MPLFSFNIYLFDEKNYRAREKERKEERKKTDTEKSSLCSSKHWVRLMQGASARSPEWVAVAQAHVPSSAAFPGMLTVSWIRQNPAPQWDADTTGYTQRWLLQGCSDIRFLQGKTFHLFPFILSPSV